MELMMIFIFLLVEPGDFIGQKQRTLQILQVRSCPEYPNLPVMITEFNRRNFVNGSYTLNITYTVNEQWPVNLEGTLSLMKCDLAGTPDTCEYYIRDLKIKNVCEKLIMRNQLWSEAVAESKPPLQCPINSKSYYMRDVGRNELFKFLPLPTAVWKMKSFLFNGQRILFCVNTDVKVIERRIME